jgi:hypothetical protein
MNTLVSKGARPFDEMTIKSKFEEKTKRLLKRKVEGWIQEWIRNSNKVDRNLSDEMMKGLSDTIKKDKYTLYRGLTWSEDSMRDNKNICNHQFHKQCIDELKSKDFLNLNLPSYTSWTTNYRVAEVYSTYKILSEGNEYGLILKVDVDRSRVLADLDGREDDEFYFYSLDDDRYIADGNQSEIILLPGEYRAEIIQVRLGKDIIQKS